MPQVKIIKASDGFDLYDGLSQIPKDGIFLRSEMETGVTNYWAGHTERRFITPFWKVKKLIESSNLNQGAIKLTNYTDPEKIDGEWVVFDRNASVGGGLNPLTNQNVAYFTFDDNLIGRLEEGFKFVKPPPPPKEQDRVIAARIGKVGGTIVVYFILGEVKLHFRFRGTGGGGYACGVRIPPK